jgi:isohexenylglutaconyl-CoA hydratase
LNGETAQKLGVVHDVHDEIELEQALSDTIQQIKRAAPWLLAMTKALLHRTFNEPLDSLLDDAAQQFAQAVGGVKVKKVRWHLFKNVYQIGPMNHKIG